MSKVLHGSRWQMAVACAGCGLLIQLVRDDLAPEPNFFRILMGSLPSGLFVFGTPYLGPIDGISQRRFVTRCVIIFGIALLYELSHMVRRDRTFDPWDILFSVVGAAAAIAVFQFISR